MSGTMSKGGEFEPVPVSVTHTVPVSVTHTVPVSVTHTVPEAEPEPQTGLLDPDYYRGAPGLLKLLEAVSIMSCRIMIRDYKVICLCHICGAVKLVEEMGKL